MEETEKPKWPCVYYCELNNTNDVDTIILFIIN